MARETTKISADRKADDHTETPDTTEVQYPRLSILDNFDDDDDYDYEENSDETDPESERDKKFRKVVKAIGKNVEAFL